MYFRCFDRHDPEKTLFTARGGLEVGNAELFFDDPA